MIQTGLNVTKHAHYARLRAAIEEKEKAFWGADNQCDDCKWAFVPDLHLKMQKSIKDYLNPQLQLQKVSNERTTLETHRPFYVFRCGHKVHKDCYEKQLKIRRENNEEAEKQEGKIKCLWCWEKSWERIQTQHGSSSPRQFGTGLL